MISWFLRRFTAAFGGLWYALRYDHSFRWQLLGIPVVLVFVVMYLWPLSEVEMLFLGLAYVLIVITELQNSAHEEALDKLHPHHDFQIGRSKDMAAGAVLSAGFFLVFVLAILICTRYFSL